MLDRISMNIGMGAGVNDVDTMATLAFRSALSPYDASIKFNLVEMDGVLDSWMWCTMIFRSLAYLCRFICWGYRMQCFYLGTAKRNGKITGDQEGCRLDLKPSPDEG